jgi:peptidoglycan/xylan/chitin deacetylase (PgdA/CDA1 family)
MMKLYWIKTNAVIKRLFSNYVWDIPNKDKKVFLTFDDGPTPEITEWTLAQLKNYNAKATFFCIGNNIQKHPEVFNTIIQDGHAIGNHTFNHLNGWKTVTREYIANAILCDSQIQKATTYNKQPLLFRPPYGKIKSRQAKLLKQMGYKIIMWDVLSADFDQTITPEQCLNNVISTVKSGSIIVFHDSVKSFKNLEYALPKTLEYLKENGFGFDVIK